MGEAAYKVVISNGVRGVGDDPIDKAFTRAAFDADGASKSINANVNAGDYLRYTLTNGGALHSDVDLEALVDDAFIGDDATPFDSVLSIRPNYNFGFFDLVASFDVGGGWNNLVNDTSLPAKQSDCITLSEIASASSHSLENSLEVLDSTGSSQARRDGGYRSRNRGLFDSTITLERFFDVRDEELLLDEEPKLLEYRVGNERTRGWYLLDSISQSGDVGSLETVSLNFVLAHGDERRLLSTIVE